jgi:GEVED domain/Ig-like domain CHU_C associated
MITNNLLKKITQLMYFLIDCVQKVKNVSVLNILLFFIVFVNNSANAQVANYTFTESSGTYTELTSPTIAIAAGWNDTVTTDTIPIGFSFGFNGTNYTTCSINSNGFITFGSTLSANTNYLPISTNTGYAGAISALGVNMWDFFLTKPITYLTTGTSPNRVFTIQWKDADRFDRGDEFNFQIQLNETTNVIKIVYGLCFPTGNNGQNINVQVGLRGAANTDFNNRSLTTNGVDWDNNTVAGTVNTAACRTRSTNYPNSGRTFIWSPVLPPTITSLATSSGCVGDVITINGTNLIGITAANIKIGGTAVTNILTITATQITATIGAGTTGLVTVQNSAGTGTSAGTFTVNAVPVITIQPVAPAVICAGVVGTRTISVTATGATSYQWRLNGVALSNFAPYSNVTTASLTITNPPLTAASTYDVIVSNATCSRTSNGVLMVVNDVPTIATTPTPTSGATGLCYSGAGAITSVSWTAVVGAVNYDVYFGAGSLPVPVTAANLIATTYTPAALVASTTYFWKVVAKNACGSAIGSSTWTFTTLGTVCTCLPTYATGPSGGDWISNVTLGVLNNNTVASLTPYYTFYNTLPIPDIQRSTTQPVSVTMAYDTNQFCAVWIDFNNDGTFAATEGFVSGNAGANTPINVNVVIPAGAVLGNVRMRVRGGNDLTLTTSQACGAGSSAFGESEEYIVNIVAATACSTPTAPTLISLSPNNTSISGSFTLPSPVADGYLIVRSISATPPSPVSGTSYTIGSTALGAGTLVIDNDNNNIFSTSGLTASTTYYFYVFSIKSICSSGTVYSTVLSGSTTTTALTVGCITATSTAKTYFINSFKTVGNLTNVDNSNTGYTNVGYTDYTSLPTTTQIAGGGINVKFSTNFSVSFKVWVDWDKNGVFDDATERVYDSNGFVAASSSFGFVVPTTALGNYRLRFRAYRLYVGPPGGNETLTALIPCGLLSNGETEDYKLTIVADCASKITNVVDGKRCDTGTVLLSASATTAATEFRWYNAEVGGTLIGTSYKIGATLDTDWTTPTLTTTTIYWVEAWSATCASFYREKVIATVNATSIITFNPTNPVVCGENTIIAVTATGDIEVVDLINEDFEGTAQLNTVNITARGLEWTTKTSTFVPTGTAVWRPAINSRNAGNKFSYTCSNITTGNIQSSLISNTLNSTGFLDLTLTYRHYFSYYPVPGDNGYVQISTNGGANWIDIFHYQSDKGEAGSFETVTIPLSAAYLNQSNLKIRYYYSSQGGNGWAIDDIRLYGTKPINTTFTWGGGADAYADALATIPYNPMTMTLATVYIKPTPLQLASPSWTFTANATIANGCVVSKPVTLTNNTRKWLGTTTNWSTASNWEPAILPTIANCVIIPATTSVISGSNVVGYAKNLNVKTTGTLNVQSSNTLIVEDLITVNTGGILNFENDASLVQINNVTNLGNIAYNRTAPSIKGSDFVYWSSPVAGQNMSSIYSTTTPGYKYFWNTVGTNSNGGLGNWNNASGTMTAGQGYIIRGSSNYNLPATNLLSTYSGVPNNGNITIKAKRGDMTASTVPSFYTNAALSITDDNWSLLGNPYPSAINGLQFLQTNSSNLVGTLHLWRHINNPAMIASPFYGTFTYNYNSNDYLGINFTGPTTPGASDIIKSGQGFMVQRIEGPQDLTGVDIIFNNAMRLNSGVPYANDNFFRNSNQNHNNINVLNNIERNRIWLDIVDDSTLKAETTLLGYIEGATNNIDNLFDGAFGLSNKTQMYSVQENKNLIIQGRALPFNANDEVQLGVNVVTNSNYKIAINTIDGLFESQDIYLEDKQLNIVHDLKLAPYNFASPIGNFNDRFILKYVNPALANNEFEILNDFKIATGQKLTLLSSNQNIKKVEIFDLLGRKVDEYKNLNTKNQVLDNLLKSNKIYIIRTTLENDAVISKKVIF